MYKNITTSAILGGIAVILGAFGSHILKDKLSPAALNSFETELFLSSFKIEKMDWCRGNQGLGMVIGEEQPRLI